MFPRLPARATFVADTNFVSTTNVSQFAQPKKHHGQQCVRIHRCVLVYQGLYILLYDNQINAHALIDQSAMVYCVSKLMEKSRVCLLYKSSRPQVSIV